MHFTRKDKNYIGVLKCGISSFVKWKYENAKRYLRDSTSAVRETTHEQKAESRVILRVARHDARHMQTEAEENSAVA